MSLDWSMALGALAMVLSVSSFAPQAYKTIRTRDTSSLSTGMYLLTVAGFACWLSYGLMNGDWPLIISNLICGCLAAFILTMKLLPQDKKEEVAESLSVGHSKPETDG